MTNRFFATILTLLTALGATVSHSFAQSPTKFLEDTYPNLMNLYRADIEKYPAHYIFAIDVSGTMNQYAPSVIPALKPFFSALPNGDRVSVIPFGTEAKELLGLSGTISPEISQSLCRNIETLYDNPNYDKKFRAHTDIGNAMMKVVSVIKKNSDYKINIFIMLTDFRNDIVGPPAGECKLKDDMLNDLHEAFESATFNTYARNIALELPVNKAACGYCLPQLREKVFPQQGTEALEIVSLNNPDAAIAQWFDQLKREILLTKLKAIVDNENKVSEVKTATQVDIDGNIIADIGWNPGKLYATLKIDSSYLAQRDGGFRIVADTTKYCKTRDRELKELELGQLKHSSWGFHHITDSVNLGLSIPTDFDHELKRLGVNKPLAGSRVKVDRWVFTFILPFWLTATIAVVLMLYAIGVIRAAARNKSARFNGKVTVQTNVGEQVLMKRLNGVETFSVGKAGAPVRVEGVEWRLSVKKVCPSAFLVFGEPYFIWNKELGYVGQRGKFDTSGRLDRKNNMVTLECGKGKKEIANKVKIVLT